MLHVRSEGSAIVGTPLRLEERKGGLCSIERGPPAGWEQEGADHYCQLRHGKRKQKRSALPQPGARGSSTHISYRKLFTQIQKIGSAEHYVNGCRPFDRSLAKNTKIHMRA